MFVRKLIIYHCRFYAHRANGNYAVNTQIYPEETELGINPVPYDVYQIPDGTFNAESNLSGTFALRNAWPEGRETWTVGQFMSKSSNYLPFEPALSLPLFSLFAAKLPF